MSTIKDVAAAAGVSVATVSNYINHTKPVSPPTEKKIKEAIASLNYTPNISAKSLKSQQYNDIGVILPDLGNPYYAQIYQGIENAFQGSGYFLNLSFSYDIPEIESNNVMNLLQKNICGLILVTCQPDNWQFYYDHFVSQDRALVLVDRLIDNLNSVFLTFDNNRSIYRITQSLLEQGKENIFLFAGPESFYCENECINGYVEALIDAGMEPDTKNIVTASLNKEEAFRQTIRIMKEFSPDAVITTSELSAMGILEGLTLLGFRSPDQIPVITLGEEHWNRHTHSFASVSTVRPAMQLGKKSAELLLNQIQSPKVFEKRHMLLNGKAPGKDLVETRAQSPQTAGKSIKLMLVETPQVNAVEGLLPHFENATGIKPVVEIVPQQYLFERIIDEHRDEAEQSDVYMYDIPWLYYLADAGILQDITEYINDPSFDSTSIFLPNCLKYFSEFEDKYYGLPFMYAPQIFYYRKDLFENSRLAADFEKEYHSKLRPPLAWQEFNAIAQFFTENNNPENTVPYGISIPTAYKECMVPEIYMRLWSYGGSLFDRQFNVAFDTPQTLKAYINYKGALKYSKPDYTDATDLSVVSDFINGETAMLITYPSFLTDIVDLRSISLTGSIGYSHVPGRTPILGGWSLGINSRSNNKDAAFQFLKWASTEENAGYFTLLGGQPAVNSVFTNDELINLYPWLPLYHAAYKYTKPVIPPYKQGKAIISQNKIDSIIYNNAEGLINDTADVSATIKSTHKELEALFQEYDY